jgi:ribose transport system substrate-binding protein
LKQVPGLDFKKIESRRDAIVVNVTRGVTQPMAQNAGARDPYLVKSVVHASRLLIGVSAPRARRLHAARSRQPIGVAEEHGVPHPLHPRTLRHGRQGRREPVPLVAAAVPQKLYRLGYAAQGTDYQFSKEVSTSLERAAAAEGIELISLDNRYNPKIAQRNADILVREKVDLVIEFQTDDHVAPIVAAKYREANIPLIRDRSAASWAPPTSAPTTTRPV